MHQERMEPASLNGRPDGSTALLIRISTCRARTGAEVSGAVSGRNATTPLRANERAAGLGPLHRVFEFLQIVRPRMQLQERAQFALGLVQLGLGRAG